MNHPGYRAALAVAQAAGCQFVRCEGFVFSHVADEGLMAQADAGRLLRYRRRIGAESLAILAAIQERGDPIIVPTLLLPEIAAAVARATDDSVGAVQYAEAAAALPHLTTVALTSTMARHAAELAATYRLRSADAVYVAVARRYGTTLVSRDEEQRSRASAAIACQTPEDAMSARQASKRKSGPR